MPRTRSTLARNLCIIFSTILIVLALSGWLFMIHMPGSSFRQSPPSLSAAEQRLREELVGHVRMIAGEIGERNLARYPQLNAAAQYIENQLAGWNVRRDSYDLEGKPCANIEAELPGASPAIVLVGAHYDSVFGSPGANDNGSGVAALLALAHRFQNKPNEKTLRFVAFVNEEPGYFQTAEMGSYIYAQRCRARGDRIDAMISLETIGYYSDKSGSQRYPAPGLGLFYPRTGNFIGFVANLGSRSLLHQALGQFRRHATIASEGAAMPEFVPGVSWSDQWSFWQHGYPGIMITDTAPFRYPHYHQPSDTPDKLNYDAMTRVVAGMEHVISALANPRGIHRELSHK